MRRPVLLVSLCAVGALALAGCSKDSGSQADPSATGDGSDALASCLVGSWSVDMSFLKDTWSQSLMGQGGYGQTVTLDSFSATQTQTLSDDKTFTAELSVAVTMTMTTSGQAVPVSVSGTGTASGTWTADHGKIQMVAEDRAGEATMSGNGTSTNVPGESALGQMVLLPPSFPVTCSGDTMTVDATGLSATFPGAPDEVVATRQ